jgi:hypothetical protein
MEEIILKKKTSRAANRTEKMEFCRFGSFLAQDCIPAENNEDIDGRSIFQQKARREFP